MKRRVLASMVGVVLAILGAGLLGAYRGPWTRVGDTGAEPVDDAVERIIADAGLASVVLPAKEPPQLDSVTTVHLDADQFEVWFQDGDALYALCVGDEASACDGSAAQVVREETVDGHRVRVARVYLVASPSDAPSGAPSGAPSDAPSDEPAQAPAVAVGSAAGSSDDDEDAVLQYWRTVRLVHADDRVPGWLGDLATTAPTTSPSPSSP